MILLYVIFHRHCQMISEKDANLLIRATNNVLMLFFRDILNTSRQIIETVVDQDYENPDFYLSCSMLLNECNSPNELLHVMHNILKVCGNEEFLQNLETSNDAKFTLNQGHLIACVAEDTLELIKSSLVPPTNSDSIEAEGTYSTVIPMILCNEEVWQYLNEYKFKMIEDFGSIVAQNLDGGDTETAFSQYQLAENLSRKFLKDLNTKISNIPFLK